MIELKLYFGNGHGHSNGHAHGNGHSIGQSIGHGHNHAHGTVTLQIRYVTLSWPVHERAIVCRHLQVVRCVEAVLISYC